MGTPQGMLVPGLTGRGGLVLKSGQLMSFPFWSLTLLCHSARCSPCSGSLPLLSPPPDFTLLIFPNLLIIRPLMNENSMMLRTGCLCFCYVLICLRQGLLKPRLSSDSLCSLKLLILLPSSSESAGIVGMCYHTQLGTLFYHLCVTSAQKRTVPGTRQTRSTNHKVDE